MVRAAARLQALHLIAWARRRLGPAGTAAAASRRDASPEAAHSTTGQLGDGAAARRGVRVSSQGLHGGFWCLGVACQPAGTRSLELTLAVQEGLVLIDRSDDLLVTVTPDRQA